MWAVRAGLSAGEQLTRAVPYVVVFSVGNMIYSGQPPRRQLICRHRLAPRSELLQCQSDLN